MDPKSLVTKLVQQRYRTSSCLLYSKQVEPDGQFTCILTIAPPGRDPMVFHSSKEHIAKNAEQQAAALALKHLQADSAPPTSDVLSRPKSQLNEEVMARYRASGIISYNTEASSQGFVSTVCIRPAGIEEQMYFSGPGPFPTKKEAENAAATAALALAFSMPPTCPSASEDVKSSVYASSVPDFNTPIPPDVYNLT